MEINNWCVLIVAILPYIWVALAKGGAEKMNHATPRISLQELEGWPLRAHWAHLNAFEAFPAFAAAVLFANLANVNIFYLNILSIAFVLCRIFHGVAYIFSLTRMRASMWALGFIDMLTIFVSPLFM